MCEATFPRGTHHSGMAAAAPPGSRDKQAGAALARTTLGALRSPPHVLTWDSSFRTEGQREELAVVGSLLQLREEDEG